MYIAPLWMLFSNVLIACIGSVMDSDFGTVIGLVAAVIRFVALVKLSARSDRFARAKNYIVAVLCVMGAMFLLPFILNEGAIMALMIIGMIATLVLGTISNYHELMGLSEMAASSSDNRLARRLRNLFYITMAFAVITAIIEPIEAVPALVTSGITCAVTIYGLVLYYQSIQLERAQGM